MGYKTADKEGKERGKRERERKIEMDSQKKVQILVFALAWKTKKLFYYVRLVGNMPFSLQNSFLATIMLICRKPVQRRGIGENAVFLLLTRTMDVLAQEQGQRCKKSAKLTLLTSTFFHNPWSVTCYIFLRKKSTHILLWSSLTFFQWIKYYFVLWQRSLCNSWISP